MTALTVTDTEALALPPFPSEIVYVNVTVPLKWARGVKLTVPPAACVTVNV